MGTTDKASENYWSDVWANTALSDPIHIDKGSVRNHPNRILHEILSRILKNYNTDNKQLIEIGCGNSAWLSYYGKTFNLNLSGLDYSKVGCEQSRAILKRDNLEGTIYLGDFFNPPAEVPTDFDFVLSAGVIEHFENTAEAIMAFSSFLKKDGIMITTLPNMTGCTAWIQKIFNKPIYDIHVPLSLERITEAHKKAGLEIIHSQYVGSNSFYINLDRINNKPVPFLKIKKLISKTLITISLAIWKLEDWVGDLPPSKLFSPAIIVVAKKTA